MEQNTEKLIDTIQTMKDRGAFKNYIEYIDFPFYKNMVERTRINFTFPLTVLVGKNGSGKSSTLHALFGAPRGKTCGDFWFSTEVDPILESGDKNRYYYGYRESQSDEIKEVIKTRMKRGSETKKEDMDYWETSRPLKKDGMIYRKRCEPVDKKVLYLDFRAEVSAFDKVFHFSKGSIDENKTLLRQRSHYLKRLFAGESMRFPGLPDSQVGSMQVLKKDIVDKISWILGKEYESIKVAEHRLFKIWGTSIYLKMRTDSKYSEANAGSGEVAIIQLVRKVEEADEFALVLLDEPEVSVHPEAQEKLKIYLLDAIKRKKLQVVISSHSPAIIKDLPDSALKLFRTNNNGKFYVTEDINFQQAFYDVEGMALDKKLLLCEDESAKIIIEKTLKYMGKEDFFEIGYFAGGEKTLISHYAVPIMLEPSLKDKVYFILDGDMNTHYQFDEKLLTTEQINDVDYLESSVVSAFGTMPKIFTDSGDEERKKQQKCDIMLKYLRFYSDNIFYLPGDKIPEEIALSSEYAISNYKDILDGFDEVNALNAKEIIGKISFSEHGDYEHTGDTISKLLYKWSKEDGILKKEFMDVIDSIFNS